MGNSQSTNGKQSSTQKMFSKAKEFKNTSLFVNLSKALKKELAKRTKKDGQSEDNTQSGQASTYSSGATTPYETAAPQKGATHRALLIGINYPGTSASLKGCINDVNNVRKYLQETHEGFSEILVLTDGF
jgi:hypothetical protein